MKHKTVETLPLESDVITIQVEKPVVRKRFAPVSRAHGKKGYDRKAFKDFKCALKN
jgi:hypothetical protein